MPENWWKNTDEAAAPITEEDLERAYKRFKELRLKPSILPLPKWLYDLHVKAFNDA